MMQAIGKEALLRKDYLTEQVETIYWGGGTPSLLEISDIEQILQHPFTWVICW